MAEKYLKNDERLHQIVDILLINGLLIDCPGLINGKMGVAIFFFHYARQTGNELFVNYAFDIIGEIQEQIHNNSPADFERGISGIGIGIDYLIRNGFLEDEEDVFSDFDKRMYRAVMFDPWQDFSLYDGLTGYGKYWIMRSAKTKQAKDCLWHIVACIEEKLHDISDWEKTDVYYFLLDLHHVSGFDAEARNALSLLEQCRMEWDKQFAGNNLSIPCTGNSEVGKIIRMIHCHRYFNNVLKDEIDIVLQQITDLNMEIPFESMGLLTGYAGEGMLRLTTIEPSIISWMNLL